MRAQSATIHFQLIEDGISRHKSYFSDHSGQFLWSSISSGLRDCPSRQWMANRVKVTSVVWYRRSIYDRIENRRSSFRVWAIDGWFGTAPGDFESIASWISITSMVKTRVLFSLIQPLFFSKAYFTTYSYYIFFFFQSYGSTTSSW